MELFKSFMYAVLGLATTGVVFYFGALGLSWLVKVWGVDTTLATVGTVFILGILTAVIYAIRDSNKYPKRGY